jgi:hypothetical protein
MESQMNYEDVLGKFLQTTLDTAEKVGEFAVAQLPELVQQALNWYFAYGLIHFVVGVALAIVAIVLEMKAFRLATAADDAKSFFDVYVVLGMVPRIPAWVIVFNLVNLQWLKIWIAPKLWLVEFATKLVTK